MKKVFSVFMFLVLGYSFVTAQDFDYDPTDYGKGRSVGISLFGDGLVGMTFKFAKEGENQWEINPSYTGRQEVFVYGDEVVLGDYYHGLSLTGGYHMYMGSKYKARKHKVIKNYIGLKASTSYRGEPEVGFGLVWHREAFREEENNYSRGLDLGLKYNRILGNGYLDQDRQLTNAAVNIYLKVDWNWFRS